MENKLGDLKDSLRIAKLDYHFYKKNMELAEEQIKIYSDEINEFEEI